jgi:hypothetical protein
MIDDLSDPKLVIRAAPWNVPYVSPDSLRSDSDMFKSMIAIAVPYVIDNVSDYFFMGNDQEFWHPQEDFPCIAPPFRCFWMEHRRPAKIVSTVDNTELNSDLASYFPKKVGVLWNAFELDEMREYSESMVGETLRWGDKTRTVSKNILNAKWFLNASVFHQWDHDHIEGPVCLFGFWIDESGNIMEFTFTMRFHAAAFDPAILRGGFDNYIFSPLLAISFLNCNNVVTDTVVPPPKLNKNYQRWTGRSLREYRTIRITPIRQVAEQTHGGKSTGMKKALVITRGHFMHSGIAPKPGAEDDRGRVRGKLFGKLIGRYWIDEQRRLNKRVFNVPA